MFVLLPSRAILRSCVAVSRLSAVVEARRAAPGLLFACRPIRLLKLCRPRLDTKQTGLKSCYRRPGVQDSQRRGSSSNPPISVTKLNQFPKATKRVFSAFARRRTGHTGITQQFGVRCFRPGPRPRPEAAYLGRRGAAAVESCGLVMAANREETLEKISTRGGVRPAEVVSGDMMALRPVGATIGPAVLARRASPRSGLFVENGRVASLERD